MGLSESAQVSISMRLKNKLHSREGRFRMTEERCRLRRGASGLSALIHKRLQSFSQREDDARAKAEDTFARALPVAVGNYHPIVKDDGSSSAGVSDWMKPR